MADTLPDTLQSLFLIQDFPLEIIVINDGSTDATDKVIGEWQSKAEKHSNISFYTLYQANRGRADALNKGVEIAGGEYISFVDADDLIDSDDLLKLWQCMKSSKKNLVLGQFRILTESGREIASRSLDNKTSTTSLIRKLAFYPVSPIHLNAFLIKRSYFLKMRGLDITNLKSEDKDLMIRLLKGTDSIKVCETFHYIYRKHDLSRVELAKKRFEWFFYRQKMINKNFSGFTKIGSTITQAFYDFIKLIYELLFRYRF